VLGFAVAVGGALALARFGEAPATDSPLAVATGEPDGS
jgi:hypothetical protein